MFKTRKGRVVISVAVSVFVLLYLIFQLHNVLRRGLDADMPELINAPSKAELRKKIAASFGQE